MKDVRSNDMINVMDLNVDRSIETSLVPIPTIALLTLAFSLIGRPIELSKPLNTNNSLCLEILVIFNCISMKKYRSILILQ